MSLETRVFFKLPPTGTASAPSLTHQDVAQLFGPFFEGGMEPLSSTCPETRTDHYLVVGGKFGGAVGVKLRNQGHEKKSSKLEVKTCISLPVVVEGDLTEDHDNTPAISLPALAAWEKVFTKIQGPVEENLEKLRELIIHGSRGNPLVGHHAANRVIVNPRTNRSVEVVVAKKRMQGWAGASGVVVEETDVEVTVLNAPWPLQVETNSWRSWAFEKGSDKTLTTVAENWKHLFQQALHCSTSADPSSLALIQNSFRVASYPEFVQYIYLDQQKTTTNETQGACSHI
jgi:hypothetical protein